MLHRCYSWYNNKTTNLYVLVYNIYICTHIATDYITQDNLGTKMTFNNFHEALHVLQ